MRTLRLRIEEALDVQRLDPTIFELAALDLIRPIYPTLAPITGGSDGGRDADIDDEDGVVRVLATTAQDVERNLKDGMAQLVKKEHDHARVIVATSQVVGAARREKLRAIAEEQGATHVTVYDRTWWALALHDAPSWRRELLGITGDPPGLVEGEVIVRRRGLVEAPYIGRKKELEIAGDPFQGDIVVIGRAGSGKTRFAAELDDALFVNTDLAIDRIADDIRALRPVIVVVDDAGRSPAVLRGLVALREDGASFRIVAAVWPEELRVVTECLSSVRQIDLPLLERSEGAELLRGLGITNNDLIGVILDQAQGRAGWLALLGTLVIHGSIRDLVEGVELGKQLRLFAERAAAHLPVDRDSALDVLGAASLMGRVSDAGEREIADLYGLPHSSVMTTLKCFREHGILEYELNEYRAPVPAIRGAAVAGLLEDPPRLHPERVLNNTTASITTALEVLVYAAHRGTVRARHNLEQLAVTAFQHEELHQRPELLAGMAVLSPRLASAFLDVMEERTIDLSVVAAASRTTREAWARALTSVAKEHHDPRALDLLLKLAFAVDGDQNEPLRRALTDFSSAATKFERTSLQHRLDLVAALSRCGDLRATKSSLPGQALAGALSPGGSFTAPDPIEGLTITFIDYIQDATDLARITDEVWPEVLAVVENLPTASVMRLLDGLADWQRAADSDRIGLDDSSKVELRRHRDQRIRDLWEICASSPALAVRWNQWTRSASTTLQPIELPNAYLAMLPLHERLDLATPSPDAGCSEGEAQRQTTELQQAAADLRAAGVETALFQIAAWLADHPEAHELRYGASHLIGLLPDDGDAVVTLAAAVDIDALHGSLGHLMRRCLALMPETWRDWWPRMLEAETGRWEAILVGLDDAHSLHELREAAVAEIGPKDAWRLDDLFTRDPKPGGALDLLLAHSAAEVRAAALVAFSFDEDGFGPALPDEWISRWDEEFVRCRPTSAWVDEWRWEKLVAGVGRHRPQVLEAHLRFHISTVDGLSPDSDLQLLSIRYLPVARRLALLDEYRDIQARNALIRQALLKDSDVALAALRAGVVSALEVADEITNEQRGVWFEAVAGQLVVAGVNPTRIVQMLQIGTWVGDASVHALELAEYADELVTRGDWALAEVGRAGSTLFREVAELEERREREQRVRG